MRKQYYIGLWLLMAIFVLAGCKKLPMPTGVDCIDEQITRMKKDPVRNPPLSLWQYTYQGQKVFYIPPFCCDIPGVLMDENCNHICAPDGGMTGEGDEQCPDFYSTRTDEKLIWQDTRSVN